MKKIIVISGPTGAGKTSLAIEAALFFNTDIISADSRQIYKGLEIGTAQPDSTQLKKIKHHLIGTFPVTMEFNAGMFEKEALQICNELFTTKDTVVVCGGTGLYIDALIYGMHDLPPADVSIRNKLGEILQNGGTEALASILNKLDPAYAAQMDTHNPQRLIRAIEVCELSGKTHAQLRSGDKSPRTFNYIYYALLPPREILYRNINSRTQEMFKKGIVEEAKKMLPYKNLNALQTVGYKEIFEMFENDTTQEETIAKISQHTRNYAKRQITWLRRNNEVVFLDPTDALDRIKFSS